MSGGASKLRDVRKLADAHAVIELDLAASELPELPLEWTAGGGNVHLQARFGRDQGFASSRVELQARLHATCQRCLAPMVWDGAASSVVLFVESENEAESAPTGWETILAPEGRVDLAALAGEEVLLALPIVPVHEVGAECHPALPVSDARTDAHADLAAEPVASAATADAPVVEMSRPFADLRAMLERGSKGSK